VDKDNTAVNYSNDTHTLISDDKQCRLCMEEADLSLRGRE